MSKYGNRQRAILIRNTKNMFDVVYIMQNIDKHENLVGQAELIDIGCQTINEVPKNKEDFLEKVDYLHNILIFRN